IDTVVTIPCGISSRPITSRSPVENIGAFYFSGLSRSIRTDAHRATMNTNGPSKLVRFTLPGRTPMLVYVRPSNEALLKARVPGAQDQRGCPSHPSHPSHQTTRATVPLSGIVESAHTCYS